MRIHAHPVLGLLSRACPLTPSLYQDEEQLTFADQFRQAMAVNGELESMLPHIQGLRPWAAMCRPLSLTSRAQTGGEDVDQATAVDYTMHLAQIYTTPAVLTHFYTALALLSQSLLEL